jgi:long-chain acyl-CoA synthetase
MVVFTTGTSTGVCKGVRLSHDNLESHLDMLRNHVSEDLLGPNDRTAPILPWTHCYGLFGECVSVMDRKGTMKTSSGILGWSYAIHTHHPTVLFVVPRLLELILERDRMLRKHFSRDTRKWLWFGPSIRFLVSGGAGLPENIHREMRDEIGVNVLQGYGCSEMSPMISLQISNDPFSNAGTLLPRIEIKFGEDGEIMTRGPNRFMGYLGKEELGPDMWYATGDIGFLSADNRLYITGRKSSHVKLSNGKFLDVDVLQTQITNAVNVRVCIWERGGSLYGVAVCPSNTDTMRTLRERWRWIEWYCREKPLNTNDGTMTLKGEPSRAALMKIYSPF